jgi:hypothetical protein
MFWCELALKGNVLYTGKVLNYFRKHPNDISTKAFVNGTFYLEYHHMLNYFTRNKIISNTLFKAICYKTYKILKYTKMHAEVTAIYSNDFSILYIMKQYLKNGYHKMRKVYNVVSNP